MTYVSDKSEHHILNMNVDDIVVAARPRLERLARMQGVAPDAIDDVVQETLLEAWRHLEYLRTPDRIDAWLNGICRNVCLRWARTQDTMSRRQTTFSSFQSENADDGDILEQIDVLDSLEFDPVEELNRQDMAVLLDRALGYLPGNSRDAVELHYLEELPHTEVAARLGLTINALEVKLHRARHRLRQVLNSELRTDAEAFGLILDDKASAGWRETSLWCFVCGRQRLLGSFELLSDGNVDMRLRCPVCSPTHDIDIIRSGGIPPLKGLRSFKPAFKRMLHEIPQFYMQACTTGIQVCPICKGTAHWRGLEPFTFPPPFSQRVMMSLECRQCGAMGTSVVSMCIFHPATQQFLEQHPRCILEPEVFTEYAGQPAIRTCITDVMSASRLIIFLHAQTLQILDTFLK